MGGERAMGGREARLRGRLIASVWTWFLLSPWTVKTRPQVKPRLRDKRGCGQTSRRHPQTDIRKERPNVGFHPKTSITISLVETALFCRNCSMRASKTMDLALSGSVRFFCSLTPFWYGMYD